MHEVSAAVSKDIWNFPVRAHQGRWRKLKGRARVILPDGTRCFAEIHWYEAHGIGKRDIKIKTIL